MIPMINRGQDRHVVGFQHIKARREHICQLAFVHKHSCLPLAHRQFGTVFDLVFFALKSPNHSVAGVIHPVDHINKFAG